ncbi:hypothetical protein GO988_07680 [Hymenobacter sp. HMF4947]|uniref:VOC domain-containing protein n=1 Tax=Hymenobacter ginkgonis TaxID=2682976 RepID=A0A7K1TD06_9BACT|nr:hypothetical protein [Hymenobacter ginkgonis]MVN76202.1 hypothetical protein [Hymenobacter ginkgonis]
MSSIKHPRVVRPASLVIRFTNPDRYQNAINLYTALLGQKPIKSQPGVFASFQVGSAARPRKRDIELRLELYKGDTTDLRGHTLIYWQIKPWNNQPAAEAIKVKLREFGYKFEKDEGQSISGESRFLMTDSFDNFFGGHTTPPFPPGGGRDATFRKYKNYPLTNCFPPVGSLLLGIVGGLVVAALLPSILRLGRAADKQVAGLPG